MNILQSQFQFRKATQYSKKEKINVSPKSYFKKNDKNVTYEVEVMEQKANP